MCWVHASLLPKRLEIMSLRISGEVQASRELLVSLVVGHHLDNFIFRIFLGNIDCNVISFLLTIPSVKMKNYHHLSAFF